MADIDVERKGPSIWPWILGLLLLALLVWAAMELFDNDEPEVVGDPVAAPVAAPATSPATGVPEAVQSYLTQCTSEQGTPTGEMGLGHEHTVSCLRQLREGVSTLTAERQPQDANVAERLAAYDSTVQRLQGSDTTATTHAGLTRDAATMAAEAMEAARGAWFSANQQVGAAVSEVREAAEGIDSSTPMLEQRESVHGFFREAGEVLRMMSQQQPAAAPPMN